jgi:hypothetical protein
VKPPDADVPQARSRAGPLTMGCHQHDFASTLDVSQPEEEEFGSPALVAESEFEFFTRRALDEARLAQQAATPAAANAHRYLAAAYSEQLARHIRVHGELEDLLTALP